MRIILFLLSPVLFTLQKPMFHPVDSDNAVTFTIKNFGINTKGEFKGLKGTISWNANDPSQSSFDVTIDPSTVNTGIKARDNDLIDEKYFDVKNYPEIRIVSAKIENGQFTGNLTIKGITKGLKFPFTATQEGDGYRFKGSFTIKRSEFNIGGGSAVLSDFVEVNLDVPVKP